MGGLRLWTRRWSALPHACSGFCFQGGPPPGSLIPRDAEKGMASWRELQQMIFSHAHDSSQPALPARLRWFLGQFSRPWVHLVPAIPPSKPVAAVHRFTAARIVLSDLVPSRGSAQLPPNIGAWSKGPHLHPLPDPHHQSCRRAVLRSRARKHRSRRGRAQIRAGWREIQARRKARSCRALVRVSAR